DDAPVMTSGAVRDLPMLRLRLVFDRPRRGHAASVQSLRLLRSRRACLNIQASETVVAVCLIPDRRAEIFGGNYSASSSMRWSAAAAAWMLNPAGGNSPSARARSSAGQP